MGIVHHSNYLRFCEEARVQWAQERGLVDYQRPESASQLAVLETAVRHLKPARFGDVLSIEVQARGEGVRILFQYRVRRGDDVLALVRTSHAPLDRELKVTRPSPQLKTILEKERWTETWLSSL